MKRIVMVLTTVLASAAALLGLVVPAQAAPSQPAVAQSVQPPPGNGCPSDGFCLYQNVNYTGRMIVYKVDQKDCKLTGFHDKASSAINNRNDRVVLFRDAGCDGPSLTVPPGGRVPNFVNRGFNDKADGVKLY